MLISFCNNCRFHDKDETIGCFFIQIKVDFHYLEIEDCIKGAPCPNDYLRIYDGDDDNSSIMMTHYGQNIVVTHTTSNQAYLKFYSDLLVQYGGFKAIITEASPGETLDCFIIRLTGVYQSIKKKFYSAYILSGPSSEAHTSLA